jgi:hypothetical protein
MCLHPAHLGDRLGLSDEGQRPDSRHPASTRPGYKQISPQASHTDILQWLSCSPEFCYLPRDELDLLVNGAILHDAANKENMWHGIFQELGWQYLRRCLFRKEVKDAALWFNKRRRRLTHPDHGDTTVTTRVDPKAFCVVFGQIKDSYEVARNYTFTFPKKSQDHLVFAQQVQRLVRSLTQPHAVLCRRTLKNLQQR